MIVIALLLAMQSVLTQAQQATHDADASSINAQLQADQNKISAIYSPDPKLLSDYRAAQRCYRDFQAYKREDVCGFELGKVNRDLAHPKEP